MSVEAYHDKTWIVTRGIGTVCNSDTLIIRAWLQFWIPETLDCLA